MMDEQPTYRARFVTMCLKTSTQRRQRRSRQASTHNGVRLFGSIRLLPAMKTTDMWYSTTSRRFGITATYLEPLGVTGV